MCKILLFLRLLKKWIMTLNQFKNKVAVAPQLDFGDIFSRAIELFQKVWLQGLLMFVLQFVSLMGVYVIVMVPMLASGFALDGQQIEEGEVLSFVLMGLLFVLYLVIIVVATILNVGLQAAFYRIVRVKDRSKDVEFGVNFGMFFKKAYLKKLVVFSLAYIGIFILSYILCVLPIFYTIIPLQFALIIFAFYPHWSINDVLTAGFKLGNKKWGIAFALLLVSTICAYVVGFIACFVGVYVTISFIFLPAYLIYKDVIGFTEDEDIIARIGE